MRLFIPLLLMASVHGASVNRASLGTDVDESLCSIRRPATTFRVVDAQIFVAITSGPIQAGESLRIDWVNPYGAIEQSAPYEQLPAAPSICFINQLPVSGFGPAGMPGSWTIRMIAGDRQVWAQTFTLESDGNSDRLRVTQVQRVTEGLRVDGAGFDAGSIVHIAVFERSGGWKYIHSLLPQGGATANRVTVLIPPLQPAEYLVIVRNGDSTMSKPFRFLVSTDSGYHLPIGPGERWIITQGPYGGFSHWRQSLHAYDIAPKAGAWVAAMRSGTAYTHDLKLKQSHKTRSFGNYITVQHANGEFSHYAHLSSGTFVVKNGQRVEAGQPLARVGNSGYTLGEGGGYHVHVHVTKEERVSSQSIPFFFEELKQSPVTKLRGVEITSSSTYSMPSGGSSLEPSNAIQASVDVAGRWDTVLTVPKAKQFIAELRWKLPESDLDLHLVSPSGHHYGITADLQGYGGQEQNRETYRIANPEPGPWRVVVEGRRGGLGAIPFEFAPTFEAAPEPTASRPPSRYSRRGRGR